MSPRKKSLVVCVLLLLQFIVFLKNDGQLFNDYYWFCDFAPGVFALFFLIDNVQAIKGFISVLLFGQLGYIIIILSKLVFGTTLMSFSFTEELTPSYLFLTLTIHFSTLIAFLATYKIETRRIALLYSLAILTLTYIVVLTFVRPSSSDETNYNLIFHSHILEGFRDYTRYWIILAFVFVAVPTHIFQYCISTYYKKILVRIRSLCSVQPRGAKKEDDSGIQNS